MLRLLKNLRKKEIGMSVFCIILVLGQVYIDLQLPDFMSDLTVLIQTPGSKMSDIWATGGKMLLCTVVSAALTLGSGYLAAKIASGFSYSVRSKLFHHVLDLGKEEMQQFSVASLITRTTNDITAIQMFLSMGIVTLVKAPVMAVWAVIKILGKSWELSAITACFAVFLITASVLIISRTIPRFKIVQKLTDKINKISRENLTGINVVHAFNAEEYQNKKFEEPNDKLMKTQRANQTLFAIFQPMMGLGMNGLSLCIYWVGAILLNNIPMADVTGRMAMFSDIVVFSTYATFVVMSFMMMVMIFMMLPAASVSAGRINEVLNTKPQIKEGTITDGKDVGTVEFQNVSFSYPDSQEEQLSNISFKVNKGETIAFIGATGSGKTTLVSLVARFYDVTKGKILVDGVDVRDYSFEGLYNKIAYITQKAVLFSGTIKENVGFGDSKKTLKEEDIHKAIDIAQATEFVDKNPEGINYRIAQSGRNVSGGQKQRLSIARAIARGAEILIFDDSFSALDYRTDAALRAGIEKELKGTTCMIVAQRISTIKHADKIVVLDRGDAVGIGTHKELMKSCQIYREIAYSQMSKEELEKEA